jgi:hypothetical protein
LRLIFVCWPFEDQGSSLVIQGYTEAAKALGHEVAVYGCPYDKIPLNYSISIGSADAVVFLFEWTIRQYYGDAVDLVRLVGKIPRRRRVIIDGDGNYNDVISVDDDFNHADSESSRRWIELCDSLSDKIYQPTRRPVRSNVRSFLFYAYNPSWERPLDFKVKEFSMLYVGHSKGRWRPMERVLSSLEPVRERLGRVGLVGHGWDSPPEWATRMHIEGAYYTDKRRLERLGVELLPAVPFAQVIRTMGNALVNPVLLRPTFGRMRLVTPDSSKRRRLERFRSSCSTRRTYATSTVRMHLRCASRTSTRRKQSPSSWSDRRNTPTLSWVCGGIWPRSIRTRRVSRN